MSETPEYDWDDHDDNRDCYQCGGEGFVWDCFDGESYDETFPESR